MTWLLSVALALACGVVVTTAERLDALAARVGSRLLLLSDVRLARELGFVPAGQPLEQTLETLVDRTLMLIEVERFQPPEPPEIRVTEVLAAARGRVGPDRWGAVLRENGVDEEYVRARMRDDLRLSAYLEQRFGALAASGGEAGPPSGEVKLPRALTVVPGAGTVRGAQQAARFAQLVTEWVTELRARGDVSVRLTPAPR